MILTHFDRRQLTRKLFLVFLIGTLLFNLAVPRANAFLPAMVLGGMAIGEALYTLAAIGVTGYSMYQIADHVWDDVWSAAPKVKAAWNSLSATAKASWASLEEATVNGTASVILTAQQWIDAAKAGFLSITGSSSTIPAFNWPGANYKFRLGTSGVLDASWIASYSIMTFSINGSTFYFVPQEIDKEGYATQNGIYARVAYTWVMGVEGGNAVIDYTMPGGATTFNREKLVVSVSSSVKGLGYSDYTITQDGTLYNRYEPNAGLGFIYGNWNDVLRGFQDSVLAYKMYMQMVYGGTAVSAPAMPGIPAINKEWDATKPVAIPVPPGAITYPQTGTKVGTLTLTAEQIKTMALEMAKAANPAIPADPTAPPDWNTTPSSKLNFEPLKMLGNVFTKKFPFSIPWDVMRQFAVFDVSPKTPVIKVDKQIPIFGTTMAMKFDIDFSYFNTIIPIARWFIIILFDLGLMMSLRRFMPE
ncbi:hypothetical protein ACQKFM_31265 [Paenibacillus xylanexedens]|uniref:hypothetical protein n=1 Tax=Paenibacillus xylanexedens TaxID=528191 RepID=UPI003D052BB6